MDVRISKCIHCTKTITYEQAKLLPGGGGVCEDCCSEHRYIVCDECSDYFIPKEGETVCDCCLTRIFTKFV